MKRSLLKVSAAAVAVAAVSLSAQAADNVWEGDDDGYWETEANWSNPSGDYWLVNDNATSKDIKFKTQAAHSYNLAIATTGVTFSGDDDTCGLSQTASDVRIGTWAYGSLTINSGSHIFNELAVPSAWWGSAQNGDLTVSGGSLTVNNYAGIGTGNAENASGATGNITVNGGSVTFLSNLNVGCFEGATGTLTLNIYDINFVLGYAYLVKWETKGDNIENPVFKNVYPNVFAPRKDNSRDKYVEFQGTFSPVTLNANDRSVLYLGADNKLYYPSDDVTVGACRGYFKLNGITAGDLPNQVRTFVLDFGDGETTSVNEELRMKSEESAGAAVWYDLQGRKLNGKPSRAGVYINNGKKTMIK